jgi:hypothetical protein
MRSFFPTELARCETWASKLLISLIFGAGAYRLLLCTPWIPGNDDGWRHLKLALRLATEGRQALSDPWHLLYFWPHPVDGWFGYHLLLAPFTTLFGGITGTKVLTSVICAGIAYVLLEIFGEIRVTHRLGWLFVATFGSGIVLFRALFGRPFLFSVFLVLLATLWTLRRNARGIFVASAIHALAYSIIFMVGLPVFVSLVLRRDRRSLLLVGACLTGLLAGSMLNPYFPENLRFTAVQAVAPLTIGQARDFKIGSELEPLDVRWIVCSLPALVLFATATARMFWPRPRAESAPATMLLFTMAALTLLVSLKAARTFDYFVPLAVIFAASQLSEWLSASALGAKFIAAFVSLSCAFNAFFAWQNVTNALTPMRFEGVSTYLLARPHPGTVFNTHWGQYNLLYYLDSRDQYIIGIDPTFMYLMDPRRYWLWRHISDDEAVTCGRPDCGSGPSRAIASAIIHDFGASHVVVEPKNNPKLDAYLRGSREFEEVYRDALTSLYAVAR